MENNANFYFNIIKKLINLIFRFKCFITSDYIEFGKNLIDDRELDQPSLLFFSGRRITRGRFLCLYTQEPSETTEKVHFFQNTNIVIKKRASRIASKAPFLLDDTFKYP